MDVRPHLPDQAYTCQASTILLSLPDFSIFELPSSNSSLISLCYLSCFNIKINVLNQSNKSDNFLRKPNYTESDATYRFQALVRSCSLFNSPCPPTSAPSPALISPCLHFLALIPPTLEILNFFSFEKHIKSICSSLTRSGKPQAFAGGFYDSQVRACFQRFFFFFIIKITAKFESYLCFYVNSCPTDTACCLLNTFATKTFNCVWSS